MSYYYIKKKSVLIAGTAILGALVAVLELSRFARMPFPLFPTLKFDIVGVPMFTSYLILGLIPGIATSIISLIIISFRSPFSGLMKFAAEFVTILGAYLILRRKKLNSMNKVFSISSSIVCRVIVMAVMNVLLLPIFLSQFYTTQAVIAIIPVISAFNAIQGAISVIGGFTVYEAIIRRIPSIGA